MAPIITKLGGLRLALSKLEEDTTKLNTAIECANIILQLCQNKKYI